MSVEYATHYRDFAVPSLRAYARRLALTALAARERSAPRFTERLRQPRVHFLYLHYVFRDEEAGFDRLLTWLEKSGHILIPYSEAVERAAKGPIDRPYVCFSFDDGVDNGLKAAEILKAHGTTGCFFLNGSNLAEEHVIKPMLYSYRHHGRKPARYLSLQEVEQLKQDDHELGGHTFNHINMAEATDDEIDADLQCNRAFLEPRFGPLQHFAWPFGRYACFSHAARARVLGAGYTSIASAERGAHLTSGEAGMCILRDNIVAAWPLSHMLYLMAQSVAQSSANPPSWDRLPA
ncbi:MAG: peptidoglycan/xylan/chitin deacetylase (PgdA/CDA1 family) [Kiritimatiellia bacterium]